MIYHHLCPITTTLTSSSTTLIVAHSSPITWHPCWSLCIPDTAASGPLHVCLLRPGMYFIQVSARSMLSSTPYICSRAIVSMPIILFTTDPAPPSQFLIVFHLLDVVFFSSQHSLSSKILNNVYCLLSLLPRKVLKVQEFLSILDKTGQKEWMNE